MQYRSVTDAGWTDIDTIANMRYSIASYAVTLQVAFAETRFGWVPGIARPDPGLPNPGN